MSEAVSLDDCSEAADGRLFLVPDASTAELESEGPSESVVAEPIDEAIVRAQRELRWLTSMQHLGITDRLYRKGNYDIVHPKAQTSPVSPGQNLSHAARFYVHFEQLTDLANRPFDHLS